MAAPGLQRRRLYRLMVEQLLDDGFYDAAQAVAQATLAPIPDTAEDGPKHQLAALLHQAEAMGAASEGAGVLNLDAEVPTGGGADVLCEAWAARHVGSAAKFSPDGTVMALGGDDGAIRVVELDSLLANGATAVAKPMLCYRDHAAPINDLDFHPRGSLIVSASQDCTMRFFEATRGSVANRAMRQCTDTHAVTSVAFHPSGDALLVGTLHAAVHLYDVSSFRCYLSANAADHHTSPIVEARWSEDGAIYASCAADTIKLWDPRTCRCARTVPTAHSGAAVNSICFGGGGRYLLSCGGDSVVRLWDTGSGRLAKAYEGAAQTSRPTGTACCFSHDEACVYSSDEHMGELVAWDARSGELLHRQGGHGLPVRCIAHSPVHAALISCGEDATVRFWVGQN